ncbi:MAG: formylglycine-generating enzyme family protein, partial [Polyangiales bacterium]
RCTDGVWERISACVDEGECFAGEVEEDDSRCGMRTRICSDECTWTDWTVMEPAGECEPGEMDTSTEGCETGEARMRMCTEECAWNAGPCEATCLDPPASSRTGADPVCIPAGDFILGHEAYLDAKPVQTITMSELHVDRFPVTKERYDMCVDAGECTVSDDPDLYDSLEPGFYATGMTPEEAIVFCEWDGGALITEYQWEKVARGPAPDARLHPWGDDPGGCDHHPWEGCTERPFAITAFPDAVSPYGVRQFGSSYELTQSRYTTSYRNISTTDPTGEMHLGYDPDGSFTRRGYHWYSADMTTTRESSASWRAWYPVFIPAFRCVY